MAVGNGLHVGGVLHRLLVDPCLEVFKSLDGGRTLLGIVIGNVERQIVGDVGVAAVMQVILGDDFARADGEDFFFDRDMRIVDHDATGRDGGSILGVGCREGHAASE